MSPSLYPGAMQPIAATLDNLGMLPQRLEVVDTGDQRTVFLNGYAAARYPCDDKVAERVLLTQLAAVVPLPDRQIAAAFQIHPVTLSRFRALARSGGAAALVPVKSGPKGPSKMTSKIEACCRALRQQGLSFRAIARRVSNTRVRISHVSVAALFQQTASAHLPQTLPLLQDTPPVQIPLPPPGAAAAVLSAESQPADVEPPAVEMTGPAAGEVQHSRYAGAMILYAALARLGVWEVLAKLGANAGPSRCFGWAQTVASVIFCFALRFRSVEDWKNGRRRDLGGLIGEASAPSVLTMRTKIKAVAESLDPVGFSRDMLQRYLALERIRRRKDGTANAGLRPKVIRTCTCMTPKVECCSSFRSRSTTRWPARFPAPWPRSVACMATNPSRWCLTGADIAE